MHNLVEPGLNLCPNGPLVSSKFCPTPFTVCGRCDVTAGQSGVAEGHGPGEASCQWADVGR